MDKPKLAELLDYIDNQNGSVVFLSYLSGFLVIAFENNKFAIYNSDNGNKIYVDFFDLSLPGIEIVEGPDCITIETRDVLLRLLLKNKKIHVEKEYKQGFFINEHEALEHEKVRQVKTVTDKYKLYTFYDDHFELLELINGLWEPKFSGEHTNWVTDAFVMYGSLFTVGYDSCIRKWSMVDGEFQGIYSLKKGWILSVTGSENELFIGIEFGYVYKIKYTDITDQSNGHGAIWNMYKLGSSILSVSEGGQIVKKTFPTQNNKSVTCSKGWVNALIISAQQDIIAVTSKGEIIFVDKDLIRSEVLNKVDLWFNNLCNVDNVIYAVSAEGKIFKFHLISKESQVFKVSRFQLIDIVYIEVQNMIIMLSVEGQLIFWNVADEKIDDIMEFDGYHFTSLSYNLDKHILYISTMEGVILIIDLYNKQAKAKLVTKGRIWKVSYCCDNKYVSYISTNLECGICDDLFEYQLSFFKLNEFATTCLLEKSCQYVGNDKGETLDYVFDIKNQNKIAEVKICNQSHAKYSLFDDFIVIFTDDSSECNACTLERDVHIIKSYNLPYIVINVTNNKELKYEVIKKSGWNKFPQILFWGYFISSGNVLPEMFETGTLLRLINNLKS